MNNKPVPPSPEDEILAAHAKAANLVGLPWADRLKRVREDRSFSTPTFIEIAIGLSANTETDATDRYRWGRIAVEAALHRRSQRTEELEAVAWAQFGSVCCVLDKFWEARSAFLRCAALRHRLRHHLEIAETWALEAAFRCSVLELREAAMLIDEALRLAIPDARDEVVATYEIRSGLIADERRDHPTAISRYLSALDRIDPATHPWLALTAGHNLVSSTSGIGHFETAMSSFLTLSRYYESYADRKLLLTRQFLLGTISEAQGQWQEAEARLHATREGYTELGLAAHAASVDFELAKGASKRRRWATAAFFAGRAADCFHSAGSLRAAALARRLYRRAEQEVRVRRN